MRTFLWQILNGQVKKAYSKIVRIETILMRRSKTFAKMSRKKRLEIIVEVSRLVEFLDLVFDKNPEFLKNLMALL